MVVSADNREPRTKTKDKKLNRRHEVGTHQKWDCRLEATSEVALGY